MNGGLTYEATAIRSEPANKLLPRSTSVSLHNDAPHERPRALNLLLAHAAGLIGGERDT
jgi:hypothetical protein